MTSEVLGGVHDLLGVLRGIEGEGGDLRGRLDDGPKRRVPVKDLDVMLPRGQGERVVVELEQEGHAADALQATGTPEMVGKGDGVDRAAPVEHLLHRVEDRAMRVEVEVRLLKVNQALLQHVLGEQHG